MYIYMCLFRIRNERVYDSVWEKGYMLNTTKV